MGRPRKYATDEDRDKANAAACKRYRDKKNKNNDDGAKVTNQNNVTGIPKVKKAIPHKAIPRRARKYSTKEAQLDRKRLMDKLWYRNLTNM